MAELPWSETGFQARDGGCAVWQLRNESGEGTITACEVFPGVMLSFNDLHMGGITTATSPRGGSCWSSTTAGRAGWNTARAGTRWPISRRGT